MGSIRSFEDIIAWQAARELAREVYKFSSTGRFGQDYSLREQVRRSAISIVSNIAEGFERGGDREFIQFLYVAKGSSGELRAQLIIAKDLEYLADDIFQKLWMMSIRTSEMIAGLIRHLVRSDHKGKKYR